MGETLYAGLFGLKLGFGALLVMLVALWLFLQVL